MKRWWIATEGIRYFMVCWLICGIGFIYLVGCGTSQPSSEEGEPGLSWWEEEEQEGNYYGPAAARAANHVCYSHGGTKELILENYGALEFVICEDGHVGSPYE